MDTPQFEQWITNSPECDDAVEANDVEDAVGSLLEAKRWAIPDRPECVDAFEQAKKYVEFKFGKTFDELRREIDQ